VSLLTPLYILGGLAIAAPIIFHLIRRQPRGEVPFSSLMFLSPTPPRLTRRSRLDDWLLLLLRAAALLLLAFAFARPFLREAVALDSGENERRRVAVLIDTSASMRRGDMWAQAQKLADEAVADCRPGDEIAVLAFDDSARPAFTFAESATLDADRRKVVARARVKDLKPTWGATDLGQALIDAVGVVEDVPDAAEKAGRMPRRVVLVTDLQQGSQLEALGAFEWPSDVTLELKTVKDDRSNASLQRLDDAPDAAGEAGLRVRVTNDAGSRRESFKLAWMSETNAKVGKPVDAYVPPGQSRVVRVPRAPQSATRLRLEGDEHGFDNTLVVADEPKREATVLYVGDDAADDAGGLLYFLERVFQETPRRSVRVQRADPSEALELQPAGSMPLVVLAAPTSAENVEQLKRYADAGGTVLVVLRTPEQATTLAALGGGSETPVTEAKAGGDVMLGEIAFDHPLFAPFAGPQFNDFTKIRFWKYRRFDADSLGEARVIARFENGDPAVAEKVLGKGRLVVFASGWNPADSQLARSSKFVPLMTALLDRRGDADRFEAANLVVNASVPLPDMGTGGASSVRKPDGATIQLKPSDTTFADADLPGVYTLESPSGLRSFAVNLDPSESKTSPLPVETLEQLGVRLTGGEAESISAEQRRQMLNAELEGRQKLWRWLILATAGVLIVETWLAGRTGRPVREEVAAA
jgi:hypothetical protein